MCTIHTVIAFDRDSTTYKCVDGDPVEIELFAFIVVDHRTCKIGYGSTENAAREHLRRLCDVPARDGR